MPAIVDLYQQVRGTPLGLGPFAGMGVLDAIKKAYRDLEADSQQQPVRNTAMGVGAPSLPMSDTTAAAPPGPVPEQQQITDPSQIPDEDIVAQFSDPRERFAALSVKYGGTPPPEAGRHFSLLDELTMRR